ncbi:hypothetical protein [Halovivax limisalsi]|uniref:hypothetical protein n=1 Tax=Halovivax limisalsi TaxID=1453760 RepID=UPI001FFDA946|nr:hypothetical protein [Halovivax limisalsi]
MSADSRDGSAPAVAADGGESVPGTRPGRAAQVRTIARALAREEWRLHVRLFGGVRFLAIPAILAVFAVGTAVALAETGTSMAGVVRGLHVFALGFGLYAGTGGFAGSDMIEDVFGPHSFLLTTAAWLPVSRRLVLGLFLLKDAVFYGIFFVGPMALAVLGLEGAAPAALSSTAIQWLSLWLAFAFGMAVTVCAIAVRTRGVPSSAIGAVVGGTIVALWWTDSLLAVVELVTTAGVVVEMAGLAGLTLVMSVGGLSIYDPAHVPPSRTTPGRYEWLRARIPGGDPLVAKSILDLGRSSGGYAKPFVSVTILLVLVGGLVDVVASITGVAPAPGLFFGGVLGLSAFTTYNWLTQFDDVEAYRIHPISVPDLFAAKRLAFVLVGAPTVAIPYALAVVWFDATALDAAVGACVLAGYSLYYYGLTVALAGFSPNEFLFDGLRFGAFGLGVALALVPTLVVGFVLGSMTPGIAVVFVATSAILAAVGVVLSNRAAAYWTERYLDGTAG